MRIFSLCILIVLSLDAMNNTPEYQHKRIEALKAEEKKEKKLQENGYKEDIKLDKNEHTKYNLKKTEFSVKKKDK